LYTYVSSQWRGKKFLIEHVVNVKTLNGSEHDGRSFNRWYGCYAFTGGRKHSIFVLTLKMLEATMCSIKNFFPRHWLLAYVTKISLLKCDRRQSHICFRLFCYDTKHLELHYGLCNNVFLDVRNDCLHE
jgi:hypothetical protein